MADAATATASSAHAYLHAIRDLDEEHGLRPLRVSEGAVPADLRGTLYRNGPGLFSSFGMRYHHLFDGDGAVSAVRFGDERVQGAVRLVESPGLLEERRRGKALFGNYGTRPGNAFERIFQKPKNTANTSVMVHQGRLFALQEASKPIELDPSTLATIGEIDFDGTVITSFSAHPHRVPARRASYNFGVRYGKDTMLDVFELPDTGKPRRMTSIRLPGPTMIHDFIATERHLVFFAPPLRLRLFRFLLGRGSYSENLEWKPELGTEILVVPIDRPEQPIRIEAPAFFTWHHANAFERGDTIVVDFVRYDDFESNDYLASFVEGRVRGNIASELGRAEIDLSARTYRYGARHRTTCEFPRVAGRVVAKEERYVYAAARGSNEPGAFLDRIAKIDLETGDARTCSLGDLVFPSEPIFVGRPGTTAEDDGYLLAHGFDAKRERTDVVVLDARDLSTVARIDFGHALPLTFHGFFERDRSNA